MTPGLWLAFWWGWFVGVVSGLAVVVFAQWATRWSWRRRVSA
jgi:hypothetical protein